MKTLPEKICLAIETTSTHLGLGFYAFGAASSRRLSSTFSNRGGRQSDIFFRTLNSVLRRAKLKKRDIDLIVVDVGPGSFTGVRVGVASARALGQALGRPVVGVNSLEALVWAAAAQRDGRFLACLPALAGEFYFAGYEKFGERLKLLLPPAWGSIEDLNRTKRRFPGLMPVSGEKPPHPDVIAQIGIHRYRAARSLSMRAVKPLYLQPCWAERKKKAGHA